MKTQTRNPYLPLDVYLPDTEAHVFGDRVYIYGSHDKENGEVYCMLDYVCYSAPVTDLSDWRCEGIIYRRDQDPHYTEDAYLWAPDVCRGNDGRYYLYYTLSTEFEIGVAVSNRPGGPFEYLGRVCRADGEVLRENIPFDPAVFNDEGRIFLYYGFAPSFPIKRAEGLSMPGASVVKLYGDMLTVQEEPCVIVPSEKYAAGTEYEGHAFFEACSMRKFGDIYYLIYCSEKAHELCYATSDRPDGGFRYGGVLISNADLGYRGNTFPRNCYANIHGTIEKIGENHYLFYHRHTHAHQCSRQGCAERIEIAGNGSIAQAEMTSMGMSGEPLANGITYSAVLACNLFAPEGGKPLPYGRYLEDVPQITSEGGLHFIDRLRDGCTAVYKYLARADRAEISISVRGAEGILEVSGGTGEMKKLRLDAGTDFQKYQTRITLPEARNVLTFTYHGDGEIAILDFTVIPEDRSAQA